MSKGSNYPGVVDVTSLQKAQQATANFKKSLDFIPNLGPAMCSRRPPSRLSACPWPIRPWK